MKKIFAILMTICLMVNVLSVASITAFAAEAPAEGVVMRVTAIKGEDTVLIGDYDNFEDGWTAAMKLAEAETYERVVVDIYTDWNANDMGKFGSGDGFDNDTIYIPVDSKVTLNLNGHTINRGLKRAEYDGEVIYISSDADVIINDGTIRGGRSENGAGGIHIKGDANVTLNNVNIVSNSTTYDGGGISVAGGSTLIVNGGSFIDNNLYSIRTTNCYGGAVYVDGAIAIFKGVEFKGNNASHKSNNYGAAIYADDSDVTIEDCVFDGNGLKNQTEKIEFATSIIQAVDSSIKVKGSSFTNNGGFFTNVDVDYSSTFIVDDSELAIETSEFRNNASDFIIADKDDSYVSISNAKFLDNKSAVMRGDSDTSNDSFFNNCTFDNNVSNEFATFYDITTVLTFYNCSMGNSTFNVKDHIKFVNEALETNAVLSVSALKTDGTTVAIDEYKIFDDGWNAAMALADDHDAMNANGYDRIVVDLLTDWNAIDSEFTDDFSNGDGFNWDTIYFQDGARMTLNMNGHTINRGLKFAESNGEVICIDENADVIINDGTIAGGYSTNGAGGIHIIGGAKVTLNKVNVNGNAVIGDDGAAIAIYDGAILIMNEGSISNNKIIAGTVVDYGISPYGSLYVCNATVNLNNVTLDSNIASHYTTEGVAIYAADSTVTMTDCVVSNNAAPVEYMSQSVIASYDSEFVITNTDFIGNAEIDEKYCDSYLLDLDDSTLTMEGGKITGNKANKLFNITDSEADIKGVSITDNASVFICVDNDIKKVTMVECTLNNNTPTDNAADIQVETKGTLAMTDCEIGDTTFNNKGFVTLNGSNFSASIFGEGSLTMIVSLVALIVSVAAIVVTVSSKKKAVPVAAAEADEE